jgi:hypothetical protein
MLRCVVCIRTGVWTPRLKDAENRRGRAQQLAGSEFVDEEAQSRRPRPSKNRAPA